MGPSAILADVTAMHLVWLLIGLIGGGGGVYLLLNVLVRQQMASAKQKANQVLDEARTQAEVIVEKGKIDAERIRLEKLKEFEQQSAQVRDELKEEQRRLEKREDNLDKKLDVLASKEKALDQGEARLAEKQAAVTERESELEGILKDQRSQLLKISGMSVEDAKSLLLTRLKHEVEHDAGAMVEKALAEAKDIAQHKSREIIITAIQRYATDHTSVSTVSTVDIPSDDMKGRVIGREGRNIRAFEAVTGINLIIDDTPEAVVLSGFDPLRREMARMTLERLITDGRIHPGRIEELYAKVTREMDEIVKQAGETACFDAGVHSLHPEVVKTMGKLKYRTSYGQNVLRHSVEVAHISATLAAELGVDAEIARRAGLLHDIGKTMTFEMEGTHAMLGADFLRKHGEKEDVVRAVAAHHMEREQESVEDVIVALADAISAARPGARREVIETYIKRLEQLEEIGQSFPGVERCFAIQAGRELRILVEPEQVDDLESIKMARDISQRIEKEVQYPGQIKVTVVRETRATEYAK